MFLIILFFVYFLYPLLYQEQIVIQFLSSLTMECYRKTMYFILDSMKQIKGLTIFLCTTSAFVPYNKFRCLVFIIFLNPATGISKPSSFSSTSMTPDICPLPPSTIIKICGNGRPSLSTRV